MLRFVLTVAVLAFPTTMGFSVVPNSRSSVRQQMSEKMRLSAKSTLTDETAWKLRILLNGVPTTGGRKVDQIFSVNAHFIEEEGYEPPQGFIKQIVSDESGENKGGLKITKSRWILSEDPNERKDGLWVWGLFKEPLYPFMLLQLESEEIELPGEEKDTIQPLKLYAQINHSRDEELGVVLKTTILNVRELETMKADPFGAATVEVYEEKGIGQISFQSQ